MQLKTMVWKKFLTRSASLTTTVEWFVAKFSVVYFTPEVAERILPDINFLVTQTFPRNSGNRSKPDYPYILNINLPIQLPKQYAFFY